MDDLIQQICGAGCLGWSVRAADSSAAVTIIRDYCRIGVEYSGRIQISDEIVFRMEILDSLRQVL
ncbi:MAG: hypothetical protein ACYS30_19170 [Planctomycetota bacterium]